MLTGILVAVYVIIVAGVIISLLLDNRTPAKTMAWGLLLIFLPVIGIIIYFFFGQNVRREKYISEHSMDLLTERSLLGFTEQEDLHVPEEQHTLVQQFASENWALPFKNNEVEIITEGHTFFSTLLHDIKTAKHSIHINTYIFDSDALGQLIADALTDKAKEGVEVRLIYDDVGSWKVRNSFWEKMRKGGVNVHAFLPVKFPAFTSKINYRNHRKMIIVDGSVAYIGGMNIAKRYLGWRDTHLRIRGNAVYGIQRAFLIDWYFVDGSLINDRRYYPAISSKINNNCVIQIVTSSPVSTWPDIMHGMVRILLQSRKYVYIETPYFLPTEPVLSAMQTAALSGVDVRLMVPAKNDAMFVQWASHSFVQQALQAGIKVYLYHGTFNHSKILVADDQLCTCGSTNIDFRSFENNFEGNAFIYDEKMAKAMKKVFEDDAEYCTEYKETNLPFFVRLRDSLFRLLAPLL